MWCVLMIKKHGKFGVGCLREFADNLYWKVYFLVFIGKGFSLIKINKCRKNGKKSARGKFPCYWYDK